jgi:hypothetical protein
MEVKLMGDRMDQLVTAAVRQGWKCWQTERGVWVFSKSGITLTATRTPETAGEWMRLVNALRGAGLTFPPGRK